MWRNNLSRRQEEKEKTLGLLGEEGLSSEEEDLLPLLLPGRDPLRLVDTMTTLFAGLSEAASSFSLTSGLFCSLRLPFLSPPLS